MAIPAIMAALGGASGGGASGIASTVAGMAGGGGAGGIGNLVGQIKSIGSPSNIASMAIGKFHKAMTALPDKILEAEQMIVSVGQKWVAALAAPISTVKQLGDAIAPFTRLSNPGGMKMFDFRVENAMATIGNILQPILDALTRSAEKVGDTFAKIKPALAPAMEAVSRFIDFAATRFADIVEFAVPGIQMVSELFLVLTKTFEMVQGPITAVIRGFTALRKILYDFLGIKTGFDKDAKSDLAVREPQFRSAEDIFREQAKNALMSSMSPKDKPETTESLLSQILDKFSNMPGEFATAIAEKILKVELYRQAKQDAGEAARSVGGGVGVFGPAGIVASRW